MKRIKTILSLFWLGVLLFALSGKTVHVFFDHGHGHEFVCKETTTHIHEKEHSCFICEFELQLTDAWTPQPYSVAYVIYQQQEHSYTAAFVPASSKFNFTERGPPAA